MQKITPFLWFDGNAEDAINFYVSIFKNSSIISVSRMGSAPDAPLFSATFNIEGQQLMVLNGGPHYRLTPAFSLFVSCNTQEEIDDLWHKLCADGGRESRCGWLVDKFGVSWQIIPSILGSLLSSPDPQIAGKVSTAMLQMGKLDIAKLKAATGLE